MDPHLSLDPQHPRPRRQAAWQRPETQQSSREGREHWLEEGRRELREALALSPNTGLARNVVLVVGDGMSLTTVAGARILKGQRAGRDGASSSLAWEDFPHLGLAKTYNVNSMVPDSAATAFAMYSGVKTNFFTMGFDSSIVLGSADSMVTSRPLDTVLDWAQVGTGTEHLLAGGEGFTIGRTRDVTRELGGACNVLQCMQKMCLSTVSI